MATHDPSGAEPPPWLGVVPFSVWPMDLIPRGTTSSGWRVRPVSMTPAFRRTSRWHSGPRPMGCCATSARRMRQLSRGHCYAATPTGLFPISTPSPRQPSTASRGASPSQPVSKFADTAGGQVVGVLDADRSCGSVARTGPAACVKDAAHITAERRVRRSIAQHGHPPGPRPTSRHYSDSVGSGWPCSVSGAIPSPDICPAWLKTSASSLLPSTCEVLPLASYTSSSPGASLTARSRSTPSRTTVDSPSRLPPRSTATRSAMAGRHPMCLPANAAVYSLTTPHDPGRHGADGCSCQGSRGHLMSVWRSSHGGSSGTSTG